VIWLLPNSEMHSEFIIYIVFNTVCPERLLLLLFNDKVLIQKPTVYDEIYDLFSLTSLGRDETKKTPQNVYHKKGNGICEF